MVPEAVAVPEPLLPLLLALTPGAVAGVRLPLTQPTVRFAADLDAFGPRIATGHDLRHAVSRIPARLVVDLGALPAPLAEAAIPVWRRQGTVVVACATDVGRLVRVCDRLLTVGADGVGWISSAALRVGQCLELRIQSRFGAATKTVSIPLTGGTPAEAILAELRAEGHRICESRIGYGARVPR